MPSRSGKEGLANRRTESCGRELSPCRALALRSILATRWRPASGVRLRLRLRPVRLGSIRAVRVGLRYRSRPNRQSRSKHSQQSRWTRPHWRWLPRWIPQSDGVQCTCRVCCSATRLRPGRRRVALRQRHGTGLICMRRVSYFGVKRGGGDMHHTIPQ